MRVPPPIDAPPLEERPEPQAWRSVQWAMRFLAPGVALLLVSLVFLAWLAAAPDPAPAAPPHGALSVQPSVVFGLAEAPTGGELTVGLLLPKTEPTLLKDVIGEEAFRAFLAAEAERAPDDAEAWDEEGVIERGWESPSRTEKRWKARQGLRRALSAAFERRHGVRLVFREVTSDACTAIPLVLAEERELTATEARDLRAYVAAGGRLCREQESAPAVGEAVPALALERRHPTEASREPLLDLCAQVLRNSRLVLRLPRDPLALQEARREGDDVVVRLAAAPHRAHLVAVATGERRPMVISPAATLRFPCPEQRLNPFRHVLEVEWDGEGVTLRRAWTLADLVGVTVRRQVLATERAQAGGTYAARVIYTNSSTGAPVADWRETFRIEQDGRTLALAEQASAASGTLDLRLPIPQAAQAGPAALCVREERFPIVIERPLRLSVVTDRTLYRETDRVHVRVMVHAVPAGRPAADCAVTLRLGKVERRVQTSAHGIASTTFPLTEAKPGLHEVSASAGEAKVTARFRVQAFEKPTFAVAVDPPELLLQRGTATAVTVRATYLNGAPVTGARVHVASGVRIDVEPWEATTDADGRAPFEVTPRAGCRGGSFEVEVRDVDGRRVSATVALRVARRAQAPFARPLNDLVVGLPCTLEVLARDRRRLRVRAGDQPEQTLELDEEGRGRLTCTPDAPALVLRFVTEDGPTERTLDVLVPEADRPLLVPARRVARVGETLHADLLGPDGRVFVDLQRAGSLVRTVSAQIRGGRGRIDLELEEDLAGHVTLHAYSLHEGQPRGTAVGVLVLRGRDLAVKATSGRETWRPGEKAVLDVAVTDAEGHPRAGVLGYWAVDRAVLELSAWSPGRETTFDLPRGGQAPEILDLAEAAQGGEAATLALSVLGVIRPTDGDTGYTLRHDSFAAGREAAAAAVRKQAGVRLEELRTAVLTALGRMPLEELALTSSPHETLRWLVARGDLDPDLLLDPWGTPWTPWSEMAWWKAPGSTQRSWSARVGFACTSAGPDLRVGTDDDLRLTWRLTHFWDDDVEALIPGRTQRFLRLVRARLLEHAPDDTLDEPFLGPSLNGTIGIGGGAGGAFGGRGGGRDLGTGGGGRKRFDAPAPVRLRKDFPPTLCFVPEVVVGPDGKARLEIDLADSITTWKTRLVASAADGATGVGYADLRVDQPLSVEPWIARRLTEGDELDVPVALRNGTAAAVTAELSLQVSDHLEIVGAQGASVPIGAGSSAAHRFRLRARRAGEARLTLTARAGDLRDSIQRSVRVRRDAREVIEVAHRTLVAAQPWQPGLAVRAKGEVRLDLHPGPIADVVSGFEGLVRKPHGCFEQTSSTLYPMVLALDYLQRTKQARPQLEDRALGLIAGGYERLLGFEVSGSSGGFSLFGKAPASAFLTAYGLMEFSDMARVYPIDPALIPRVVAYLRGRQAADGSWTPSRFAHQELWAAGKHPAFNCTAYTAWALAKAGATKEVDRALDWLKARSADVESPYSLALAALAFLTRDDESPTGHRLAQRLAEAAVHEEAGPRWVAKGPTGLGARGRTADIEASALTLQALLLHGRSSSLAQGGLERLIGWRGADGRFGTTQSTILALQALLAAEGGGDARPATVRVLLDGREVAREAVSTDSSAPLHLDLGSVDPARLRVHVDGERRVRTTLVQRAWVPWAARSTSAGRLELDVRYPTDVLAVGAPAKAVVTLRNRSADQAGLVTAEIGLPPGCDVDPTLVTGAGLERVERSEDALVLYLLDMAPGAKTTIQVPFVPRHYLDVKTTPSTAYEYYVPHEATVVPPRRVRAK